MVTRDERIKREQEMAKVRLEYEEWDRKHPVGKWIARVFQVVFAAGIIWTTGYYLLGAFAPVSPRGAAPVTLQGDMR
jgi:hypothetical protein